MAAYAQDSQFLSRRLIVLVVIILFHVLLVWALANGLAHHIVELIAPPLQTQIIEEVKKQDQPPPPPPPTLERPPVEIPPTDIAIDLPVESTTTAITNVTDKPVVRAPPPPPAPKVAGTPARVNVKGFPNSEDFYPPSSKRLEETGAPVVRVCVDPKGKLIGEPTIATSSNFPKLDEAAIKLAKAGAGHYIAGTQDGQPLPESCLSFRVVFKIGG